MSFRGSAKGQAGRVRKDGKRAQAEAPPARVSTVKEIAAIAKVSVATVSRALQRPEVVSESTRQRIHEVVKRLGYTPNALARNLRTARTRLIVALLPDIANPFFSEVIRGIEQVAHENGYSVLLGETQSSQVREQAYADMTSQLAGAKGREQALDRLKTNIQFGEQHALHGNEARLARDQCLDELVRRLSAQAGELALPEAGSTDQLLRARDFLHDRMAGDIGLDELARHSGMDRFRLTRQFKRRFGQSPHAYLVRLRLRAARALLAGGGEPNQVALDVGFADQSHLGRWFQRAYRLSPAAYQRECTNVLDRHVDTAETTTSTAYDTLKVQVLNSSGTVLATLATYSNLNKGTGYTVHTANLTPYIGQTVTIKFTGAEDSSLQTSFVLDDVTLTVQ